MGRKNGNAERQERRKAFEWKKERKIKSLTFKSNDKKPLKSINKNLNPRSRGAGKKC